METKNPEVKKPETKKTEPKKRKSVNCIGCKKAKPLGNNAFTCTSNKPDMKDFTCYE